MQKTELQLASLSRQQMLHWKWRQANQIYGSQAMFLLEGTFIRESFQQALQQSVQRHEILRTTFSMMPGMDLPMQVIGRCAEVSSSLMNLQNLDYATQQSVLTQQWQDLLQRPFDLEHGPLSYTLLFCLNERQHALLLRMCPLCADTGTLKYFIEDVLQCYDTLLQKHASSSTDDNILQYIDVISWQNDLLTSEDAPKQQKFWETFDFSFLSSLQLPLKSDTGSLSLTQERRATPAFPFHSYPIALEQSWQERLWNLSQSPQVSLEAYLLTCWQILLWRLTGTSPLIGIARDGRSYEDLATVIGPYTHTVPFSLSLSGDLCFTEALAETTHTLQEMNEKQLYFNLQSSSAQEEHVFPISFSHAIWPQYWQATSLKASLQYQESWCEPSQIHLQITQIGQQVQIHLLAQPVAFSQLEIQRLANCFQTLLQGTLTNPQAPIGTLPLLTPTEQQEQQARWRGQTRALPFLPLHQRFQQQALLHPHAPALRCGEVLLSYEHLDLLSNQLAHWLLAHGLCCGDRVALYLPRDQWAIICLLGVLKAGGCYVPLDDQVPPARLHALLTALAPAVVLSSLALSAHLPSIAAPILLCDQTPTPLDAYPHTPPALAVPAEQIAYVMYTSGSTSLPKGVLISQASVSHYTQSLCDLLLVKPGWHFATVSSLAADLGNTSIFCSLASGGCLHVLPYALVTDGAAFAHYVEQFPLDVLKIVPSHLQALLASSPAPLLPRHRLILGGEALPWSLLEQLHTLGGPCQLYNHYGPTETTIGALVQPLGPLSALSLATEEHTIPLGHPLPNTQVVLLDAHQQMVPPGVLGELYLSGAGLAAGYLNDEAHTQARFVHLPLGAAGQRWYRTGDLVRETTQGDLLFVGREDRQVKVRGYRIEPAEIEAHLLALPTIREAVVTLRRESEEHVSFTGYIIPWKKPAPTQQEVRNALGERLPAYLIPAAIVALEHWPLTPNGKLDYPRLPLPASPALAARSQAPSEAARTPLEEVVSGVWQEILALPSVGRHENFFVLGGHSLLGTRMIARLRTLLGVEVPIRWLFEAPTIAGVARALEEAVRQDQGGQAPALQPIARQGPLPLSFAQQRLWFLDQLEPGNSAYNVPRATRLHGALDTHALHEAVLALQQRHEILRTCFPSRDGDPVQAIATKPQSPLRLIDLTGLCEPECEALRLARQESEQPFDLAQGPLLRCWLLQLAEEEQVLVLTMHHIISDGWSGTLLVEELTRLYHACKDDQDAALPALPIQYADYASWQRNWLQGDVLQEQLDYWKDNLAGLTPLALPTDHPRPAVQTTEGAQQSLQLSARLSQDLRALSQREGATLFMTLLAAFQILLARYSGQQDIAVGTPIANRTREEIEGLIGCFVNTLVLRSDLSGNPSFVELLARVRGTALGAYAHQEVPFEQVVEVLQPERDQSRSPLFQVLFALQNTPRAEITSPQPSLQSEEFFVEQHTTKFELSMAIVESEQGLYITLEYNTDLFESATITRLLSHWQQLLTGIVTDPELPISALPLLTEQECVQMLVEWNATGRKEQTIHSIHRLFEEQAKGTPEAIALVFAENQLTYAELNRRANQVAHLLQELKVGPEIAVALFFERSLEQIISLLGVLKAGGAYIPLDPAYPQERVSFILADARPAVLLTQKHLKETVPPCEASLFSLDSEGQALLARQSGENLNQIITADNLAYIMYTSGSTGLPKGVQVAHGAVVNLLQAMQPHLGVPQQAVVAAITTLAFDIAALELLLPMLWGGRCVLVNRNVVIDGEQLSELLMQEGMTLVQATPATWQMLLAAGWHGGSHIRLLCGGEALPRSLADQLLERGGSLWNVYGPTETTIYSASGQVETGGEAVWIGHPIANTQLYVLDAYLQPVPIGVAGELYIGGVGVARGYLHRPDLTAERFVPHPFSQQEGMRLYRTGDQMRYRADGTLEYLGRLDLQVKLRGYRIELGEIEEVLDQHPQVRQSVVILKGKEAREKQLVAYVLREAGANIAPNITGALRSYLQGKLPEYMIPTHILVLDALPLTPNGKIDRRSLPEPSSLEEEQGNNADKSDLGPIEELVQQVWQQVLARPHVSMQENFFEIGGHSLLATQVIARLRRIMGMDIPLRMLFEAPTVPKLAVQLLQRLQQDLGLQAPPITIMPREQALPLSFAQQRMWLLDQLEPGNTAYIIPVSVRLRGAMNQVALKQALIAVIQRHETLRTIFPNQDGEPIQQIVSKPLSHLNRIDLTHLLPQQREREAQKLAQQETQQAFDLAVGPLVRCKLLQIAMEDHVLLLTMHHIVSDGWSIGILMRELSSFYTGIGNGTPVQLPALPIQYADYAAWQRSWLQGEVLLRQLNYWKVQLATLPFLELPTDRPRPASQSYRGARQHMQVPIKLSQDLYALSQQEGVTLFMTLVAAFQVLLARYSHQKDFAIGTPIANRTREEIEGLIGFFLNTLVLRSNLQGNPTFVELLAHVRSTALSAYAHQDVPFEQIVEALQPERDRSRSPLFQVLFQLQNIPEDEIPVRQTSVGMESFSVERHTAQLDLRMIVTESEQGLSTTLEYNTDLFEQATIQHLLEHFHTLLEGIAHTPNQRVWSLPLLSRMQRHELLKQANQSRHEEAPLRSYGALLAQHVAHTPERIAISDQYGQLTYAALLERVQHLARALMCKRVGPEILVGIALERSSNWLISLLAVWQCAGAVVPLDPTYPGERLLHLLHQAQPALLLTTQAIYERLPAHTGQTLFLEAVLEQPTPSAASSHETANAWSLQPQQLAYVLFTSGSTGTPKGVMITQEGMLNHLWAKIHTLALTDQDRVAQTASQSFDISLWQLLVAPLRGGQVHILPDRITHDPAALLSTVYEQGISVLQVVPAVLAAMLDEPQATQLSRSALRWLSVTGEAMPKALCAHWWRQRGQIRLLNAYGPTECSDDVSHALLEPEMVDGSWRVPIGYPINNIRLYVLDEQMEPVPQGVIGEIYVGGRGVGRGYLTESSKTAEVFVPDPYDTQGGGRLYRTGDQGRMRLDRQLEFVERKDEQVKVRGYRIELGEIESVLANHPAIQQSVVVLKERANQEKQLVAYVVEEEKRGTELKISELAGYLKGKLPDYMIPAHFVQMQALPLTLAGKVDRRELISLPLNVRTEEFVVYRDAIEYQLRDIWSELLGIRSISITDNFFDLGGHSILAVRLMSRIQQTFERNLPLSALFQYQTVAELATLIREQLPREMDASIIVPFQRNGTQIPFFCIHPTGGEVYEYRNISRYIGEKQPFYGIRMPDPGKHVEEFRTLEGIAHYYLTAIREIQPQGPYQLGGWSSGGLIAYEMAQQLKRQGDDVRLLALIDSYVPIHKQKEEKREEINDARIVQALMERYHVTLPAELAREEDPVVQFAYVYEELKQRNIAPADVSLQQIHFFAHIRETVISAVKHYIPQPYTGRITLLRASDAESKVQAYYADELTAHGQISNGWRNLALQGVDIHAVPGSHITLVEEPYVRELAASLGHCLIPEQH